MEYRTANDVLDAHWDGGLPVDPLAIAKAMGVEVCVTTPFQDDYDPNETRPKAPDYLQLF
jgi:hypothetical protein